MQYFIVKSNVELALPHKKKRLVAVTYEEFSSKQIPLDKIYCGFIAWEHIQAQKLIGAKNTLIINPQAISADLLPFRIRSFADAGDIVAQLQCHTSSNPENQNLKIALINGTGTMLGDTVVGASVLIHIYNYLRNKGFNPEIDVYCSWNARPGVEEIWRQSPTVRNVFDSSPTIADLRQYDAYWDYSHLLRMEGYSTEHFGDFYFNHFGVNPAVVEPKYKLPSIRVNQQAYVDTQNELNRLKGNHKLIFIQPEASNGARSMPDSFVAALIKGLSKVEGHRLVMSSNLPKALSNFERKQIINLHEFTHGNIDRYLSLIALSDSVISVDTLALHVAMGCNKPGIGIFSLSEPSIRLKYSPQIKGVLIPDAQSLPYWGKHKSDDHWQDHAKDYERSWMQLPLEALIEHILGNAA